MVWVDSTRIAESMRAAESLEGAYIGISSKRGFHDKSLAFLSDYPGVERVILPFASGMDVTPLRTIRSLKHLTIRESREPLDLAWFPDLQELRTDWHKKIAWHPHTGIRDLYLRGYSPITNGFQSLPPMARLARLEVDHGNVRTLDGISRFPALRHLELYYLTKLQSMQAIAREKQPLRFLQAGTCRAVRDFQDLRHVKSLEILRLNNCGRLASLAFLNELPDLREFRFVNTLVEDGDMAPLLRLKSVGFLARRGYSHTPEEVDALIARGEAEHRSNGGPHDRFE